MKRFPGLALVLLACTFGLIGGGVAIYLRPAEATRNSSGTYSLPSGNPVVAGTTISTTTHNNTMSDIASEMTDSLSRSGKGGMSAALKGTDGTVAAPAYSFTSEAGTGLYRIGSTDVGFSVNGTKKLELTSSLFTVTPALTVTGATILSSTLAVSGSIGQTVSGSASTVSQSWLEPSLSNGNSLSAIWGTAASNNASGALVFTPNATAANSTWCMSVFGQTSTLCTDGNGTTKLGGSGSAVSNVVWANCNLVSGSPSTCTATVATSSRCVCTVNSTGGAINCTASVSGTTATFASSTATSQPAWGICWN